MISTERKLVIAAIPGMVLGYFWSLHPAVQAMAILMFIDFISGTMLAWSRGDLNSEASRKGIVRKALAMMLVGAVHVLGTAFKFDVDLSAMLAGWFCVTEVISVAENAARAGWALPAFLTKALSAIKDQADPKVEPVKGKEQ